MAALATISSTQPPPNIVKVRNTPARAELDDIYFLFIVIGCSVAGIAGLALAGYCWYKLHTTGKAVSEAEYTEYGSRKPSEGIKGGQKLDYNAEMYHYHRTKSQLAAMEKAKGAGSVKGEDLDDEESADEGDNGDFTVYECPGLAPTMEMLHQQVAGYRAFQALSTHHLLLAVIVIGCSVAGIAGLALAGYCWYKLHTTAKAVSEAEYTGYGSRKPSEGIKGDQKLDYNAEMYHYHQTKSQLAAMEKAKGAGSVKGEDLDDEESADEGDNGDFTVYECPGLAPTGDMTVVNPLFSDQENVGSDQDTNGHSGKTSPVISKDAHRDK